LQAGVVVVVVVVVAIGIPFLASAIVALFHFICFGFSRFNGGVMA